MFIRVCGVLSCAAWLSWAALPAASHAEIPVSNAISFTTICSSPKTITAWEIYSWKQEIYSNLVSCFPFCSFINTLISDLDNLSLNRPWAELTKHLKHNSYTLLTGWCGTPYEGVDLFSGCGCRRQCSSIWQSKVSISRIDLSWSQLCYQECQRSYRGCWRTKLIFPCLHVHLRWSRPPRRLLPAGTNKCVIITNNPPWPRHTRGYKLPSGLCRLNAAHSEATNFAITPNFISTVEMSKESAVGWGVSRSTAGERASLLWLAQFLSAQRRWHMS